MEATTVSIHRGMDQEATVRIYNGILLSHKKTEILPFAATWVDLENIILIKTEEDKYYNDITYVDSKK